MDQWLASLPRRVLAIGAIAFGIIFIIVSDPPHTLCDSQTELFTNNQTGFLFLDKKQKGVVTTGATRLVDSCKVTNSPGGCYELFGELRGLVKELRSMGGECVADITNLAPVKNLVWESMGLMTRVAWGETAPKSALLKYGWLDPADMNLFCQMKSLSLDFYGQAAWDSFREKTMTELPGADSLTRNDLWAKTILSANCLQFQ